MKINHTYVSFTIFHGEDDDEELNVSGKLYHGLPAKIDALPEDCYPAEDPEFEIEVALCENGTEYMGELDEDKLLEAAIEASIE